MSLSTFCTSQHPYVFRSLVVLCLFIIFFLAYYNSGMKLPTFDFSMEWGNYSCPKVMCENETMIQHPTPNCSTQLQIKPDKKETVKIQPAPVDNEPDTILLIWLYPWNVKYDHSCSKYNIKKCHMTDDRSFYHKADGVLIHHHDIFPDMRNMPKDPRPWFQKWIWFNMEATLHTPRLPQMNNVFNLTCNFRLDSNIPVPYGIAEPVTSGDESFKLPPKDKLVCWIVSAWDPEYERVSFYHELRKHINISTYGKGFGIRVVYEDYIKIVTSCKFYLAFENSIYKDYITEKSFRTLTLGTVPVVLGPSRQSYENQIPGDSFIHVNDFSSPKELAQRILYLDKNNAEYMRYFDWRKRYKVRETNFGTEHACKTCDYLRKNRGYEAFQDLNKWYWD